MFVSSEFTDLEATRNIPTVSRCTTDLVSNEADFRSSCITADSFDVASITDECSNILRWNQQLCITTEAQNKKFLSQHQTVK